MVHLIPLDFEYPHWIFALFPFLRKAAIHDIPKTTSTQCRCNLRARRFYVWNCRVDVAISLANVWVCSKGKQFKPGVGSELILPWRGFQRDDYPDTCNLRPVEPPKIATAATHQFGVSCQYLGSSSPANSLDRGFDMDHRTDWKKTRKERAKKDKNTLRRRM